jgi:hypothetical protein
MKTYIADIIPKIQRFSKCLDDLTRLTNQHWVSLGDINEYKRVYIFRANNQLLISTNGRVEKGTWEYLGNQSLLIESQDESYLLKHGFFDENVIALKLDSTDSYAFFVNETKYDNELNSISDIINFLEKKYLKSDMISGLNSTPNQKVFEDVSFSYVVEDQTKSFDIFWGSYIVYRLKFSSGQFGFAYKGSTSGKFFYMDLTYGRRYFNILDEVAYGLYVYLKSENKG